MSGSDTTAVQPPVHGAIAGRYWVGTPGFSEVISGVLWMHQEVADQDREQVMRECKEAFRDQVRIQLHQRTGLYLSKRHADLERIEWLVLWDADDQIQERVQAFQEGWSRALPPGVRARDLTGAQISRLGRMIGARPGWIKHLDQQQERDTSS